MKQTKITDAVIIAELDNIKHLKMNNANLAKLLLSSKNAKLRRYAVRIKKSGKKLLINDDNENIKAINLSQLRIDFLFFYYQKNSIILNLIKNIDKLYLEHDDTVFLSVTLQYENCHVSELSQTLSNLNKAWSLFITDPKTKSSYCGFFKYINIKEISDNNVNVSIYAILHITRDFLYECNKTINKVWEFYRSRYVKNANYDCEHSIISFNPMLVDYRKYLESSVQFCDLSSSNLSFVEQFINQTYRKKLICHDGTMMNYHY